MKLFLKPGSCSLASHIVLEEIGRPYDTETVDLAKKLTASGAEATARLGEQLVSTGDQLRAATAQFRV